MMIAGDIRNARLVLEHAAKAHNAAAVLELGATYDPFILQQLAAGKTASRGVESVPAMTDMTNIERARRLYEEARGLGSTEAAVRLDRLRSVPIELWR